MHTGLANNETRHILSDCVQRLNNDGFHSILLAHCGELNQDLINSLTVNVEDMMLSSGDRKPLIKRVFSILIEGLQNILIHGERVDDEQLALVVVACNENHYRVVLGNVANAMDREKLIGYLTKLNAMNDEEVKAFYLEVLNNGLISAKGGAGLGFITMRMKSKALLQYSFDQWNDHQLFFTISTELDKQG